MPKDVKAVSFILHIRNECSRMQSPESNEAMCYNDNVGGPSRVFFKGCLVLPRTCLSHRISSYLTVVILFCCFMVVVLCHLWPDLGNPRPFLRVIWKHDPYCILPSIQPPSRAEEQNSKKHKKRHRKNMKCGCAAEFWLVQVVEAGNY